MVELAEGQGPEALERAVSPPERLVSSEALFPTARAGDDPFGLARIHRVEIAGIDASVSDWDAAYRIAERGGYATVEPDRDDTLLPEFGRTAACFDDTFLAGWRERFPAAEVHRFADAGHYVLEDAGEQVVERMRAFFARTAPAPVR